MLCKPKNVTTQQSLNLKANKSRTSLCSKTAAVAWLVDGHDSRIELNEKKKLCSIVLFLLNIIETEIQVFTILLAK